MGIGSGFDLGGSCMLLGGGGRVLNLSLVGSPVCVLLPPGPRLPRPSSPPLQRCSVSGLSASLPSSGSQSCVHVADFWDTAGQERFQSMHASYYHKAHACIMVWNQLGGRGCAGLAWGVKGWGPEPSWPGLGAGGRIRAGFRLQRFCMRACLGQRLIWGEGEGGLWRRHSFRRSRFRACQPSQSQTQPLPSGATDCFFRCSCPALVLKVQSLIKSSRV